MDRYNYEEFSAASYDLESFGGPATGAKAPDFELTSLEQHKIRLLDFSGDFLVLEMGSITCPLFQGRRNGMSTLVAEFPHVSFAVLYTREAHPGAELPAHKSLDDKIAHGQILRTEDGEVREILIDDLEGSAHAAYGGYPNSIFIINRMGCVVFKSDWNSVSATRRALAQLLEGKAAQAKSYFLPAKPTVTMRILRRSGKGSLQDFLSSLPTLFWKNLVRRNFQLLVDSDRPIQPTAEC